MDYESEKDSSINHKPKRIQYHKGKPSKPRPKKKMINPIAFTPQEDQTIMNLVDKYGPRFNIIQIHFPTRNQNHLKNRYYKHLRKNEILQEKSPEVPLTIEEEKHCDVLSDTSDDLKDKKFMKFIDDLQSIELNSESVQIMSTLFSSLDKWIGMNN